MKLSFRCDTTYFRQCMSKPAGKVPTVGTVWKAIGFAALSVSLLCVAVGTGQLWLACFCVALMGVAFQILLPR
jgi:hypothetical protein